MAPHASRNTQRYRRATPQEPNTAPPFSITSLPGSSFNLFSHLWLCATRGVSARSPVSRVPGPQTRQIDPDRLLASWPTAHMDDAMATEAQVAAI